MDWLQDAFSSGGGAVLGGFLGVVGFFVLIAILKGIIKVNLPDQLLVVTGRKRTKEGKSFGFSVERGRRVKIPYFQSVSDLDLGVIPISVRVEGVNSANGITVGADATACVCVDDDDEAMLYTAVERLMGKDREQIAAQIQQTLVGNFRGALNKATPLQAIGMEESWKEEADVDAESPESDAVEGTEQGERAQFRAELFRDINSDLASFGMKVVSVSLQKIWDTSNYIGNLAQKTLAQKRQDVEIEEARLGALAEKAESDAVRRTDVAKSQADEKILAAREKLEVYRRESTAAIEQGRLEADHAIEEAANRGQREVQACLVDLQKLKNQSTVTLEAEARARATETIAAGERKSVEIREQARNEILRQKVDMLASAGKTGQIVLFVQQQLPHLFEAFHSQAQGMNVDSLVIMDDDRGFNGAVNRGPAAFVDFLSYFEEAMGVSANDLLSDKEVGA